MTNTEYAPIAVPVTDDDDVEEQLDGETADEQLEMSGIGGKESTIKNSSRPSASRPTSLEVVAPATLQEVGVCLCSRIGFSSCCLL